MLCPYCTQEIKDDARFCAKCGHRIARCPSCNGVLTTRVRFCLNDGTPIPEELIQDLPSVEEAPSVKSKPKKIVISQTPQKRFCKQCGKICAAGQELCPDCMTAKNQQNNVSENSHRKKKNKSILPAVLGIILVLLLGGVALGFGIITGKIPFFSTNDQAGVARVDDRDAGEEPAEKNEISLDTEKEDDTPDSVGEDNDTPAAEREDSQKQETPVSGNDEAEEKEEEEHRYEVIAADISWSDANEKAFQSGGHLVTITSSKEFEEVCEVAEKSGLKYLWMGALLTSSKMDWGDDNSWITREKWTFDKWYPGEPSKEDADGTKEYYLCLWNAQYDEEDIGWTFNDQRNDIVKDFPGLSGQVGYIIEYGDGLGK